jgi:hypothetical protein
VACDPDALIAALTLANADSGGTLSLAHKCTYTLTAFSAAPPAATAGDGLPAIVQPITIIGNDATIVRAANANPFRIFDVVNGGSLTLQNVTVAGGQDSITSPNGAGIRIQAGGNVNLAHTTVRNNQAAVGAGGGIDNAGVLLLTDSAVTDNTAATDGGGVRNTGFFGINNSTLNGNAAARGGAVFSGGGLEIINSTLSHNEASQQGGGLFVNTPGPSTTVNHSNISDNDATSNGGGIFTQGILALRGGSTVSDNFSGAAGGGIFNSLALTVEDSKITGNTSRGNGGGLLNSTADAVLRRAEVSGNNATGPASQGGGIATSSIAGGGSLFLFSTQVINNSSTIGPGGVFDTGTPDTVDQLSTIVGNRPTNCTNSSTVVLNCFG